jgi:hypothetical protein
LNTPAFIVASGRDAGLSGTSDPVTGLTQSALVPTAEGIVDLLVGPFHYEGFPPRSATDLSSPLSFKPGESAAPDQRRVAAGILDKFCHPCLPCIAQVTEGYCNKQSFGAAWPMVESTEEVSTHGINRQESK